MTDERNPPRPRMAEPTRRAAPAPEASPPTPPPPIPVEPSKPPTVRETLRRADSAFSVFLAAAARFPAERMDEHLAEDAWTRKQMLAHVAAWHDLTTDRLGKMIASGKPEPLDAEPDAINARVARQAVGKTAGEVLKDVEMTYKRLRRQLERMTDAQLRQDDAWAAEIIAGNTFEHYAEHMADVYMPDPEPQARRR